MHTPHGALVRMLQLERAVYRMTLQAQGIIEILEERGEDVSSLEGILEEMNLLLEDIQAFDSTQSPQESVKNFVALKKEALTLRKEFRDAARLLLSVEDKEELRLRFGDIDREKLSEYHERVREEKRDYNIERLKELGGEAGIDVSELESELRAGDIDSDAALRRLREAYLAMDEDSRREAKERLQEYILEERKEEIELLKKARERLAETLKENAQERAKELRAKGIEVRSSLRERSA